MKAGDLIYQFGDIKMKNFFGVQETIAPYSKANLNKPQRVIVARKDTSGDEKKIELTVTPSKWIGYGVLGCHFYCLRNKEGAFVKVKDLNVKSPAYKCGIREKDRIVEFGTITAETYVDLKRSVLPMIMDNGLGNPIHVLLQRKDAEGCEHYKSLIFIPERWEGEPLVGFTFKRIKPHNIAQRFAEGLIGGFGGLRVSSVKKTHQLKEMKNVKMDGGYAGLIA